MHFSLVCTKEKKPFSSYRSGRPRKSNFDLRPWLSFVTVSYSKETLAWRWSCPFFSQEMKNENKRSILNSRPRRPRPFCHGPRETENLRTCEMILQRDMHRPTFDTLFFANTEIGVIAAIATRISQRSELRMCGRNASNFARLLKTVCNKMEHKACILRPLEPCTYYV